MEDQAKEWGTEEFEQNSPRKFFIEGALGHSQHFWGTCDARD